MPGPAEDRSQVVSGRLWWSIVGILLAIIVVGAGTVLWIASGATDPRPPGSVLWNVEAEADCLDVTSLELPLLRVPGAVELRADNAAASSSLVSWGLWLDEPASTFRWEVLAPGYYRHAGLTYSFHHVRTGMNTLRVDVADDRITLWLNNERALQMEPAGPVARWGLIDGGVCWRRMTVYGAD